MTPEEYQEQATRFVDPKLVDEILLTGAFGLISEVAEIIEHIDMWRLHAHPIDKKAFALECGDLLWYIIMLLTELGIPLENVMKLNIEKLSRRYPNGFTPDASIKRKEQQIL